MIRGLFAVGIAAGLALATLPVGVAARGLAGTRLTQLARYFLEDRQSTITSALSIMVRMAGRSSRLMHCADLSPGPLTTRSGQELLEFPYPYREEIISLSRQFQRIPPLRGPIDPRRSLPLPHNRACAGH